MDFQEGGSLFLKAGEMDVGVFFISDKGIFRKRKIPPLHEMERGLKRERLKKSPLFYSGSFFYPLIGRRAR